MAIVENASFVIDQRKDVVNGGVGGSGSGSNSAWKIPVEKPVESPVMGEKMWPSLSDVQLPKTSIEVPKTDPQVSSGHKKSNGGGSGNFSHKHGRSRSHKGGLKRNQNGAPPFPVPVVPPPVYYRPLVPVLSPIPVRGYSCQPMPLPFPGVNNHLAKSGSQTRMKVFRPHPHDMNVSQNIQPQPPAQGYQAVSAPKYSVGRPNATEGGSGALGGPMYLRWQRESPFGPKGGIIMHQNMAPRASMRPAVLGPAPFAVGPAFPGPQLMHYRPMPPPGSFRAPFPPRFAPRLINPLASDIPPELLALRNSIAKQIEYYFSTENLLTDHYLISQMDDHGWVPISVISGFKRVKSMCTNARFILDALQGSPLVEVQGFKVRKRDSTSKYTAISPSTDVKNISLSEEKTVSPTACSNGSLSEHDSKVDSSEGTEMLSCSAATNVDGLSNEVSSTLIA